MAVSDADWTPDEVRRIRAAEKEAAEEAQCKTEREALRAAKAGGLVAEAPTTARGTDYIVLHCR